MLFVCVFPFSLKDQAKAWLDTKTNITTLDQMQNEFLKKFFSIGKLTALRCAVPTFSQHKISNCMKVGNRFCKVVLTMRLLRSNLSIVFILA